MNSKNNEPEIKKIEIKDLIDRVVTHSVNIVISIISEEFGLDRSNIEEVVNNKVNSKDISSIMENAAKYSNV